MSRHSARFSAVIDKRWLEWAVILATISISTSAFAQFGPGSGPGGGGLPPGDDNEIEVKLEFLGPEDEWIDGNDTVCEFNVNHDFDELRADEISGENKDRWSDNGIAPIGADDTTKLSTLNRGVWYQEQWDFEDKSYLECIKTDDRLVSIKLHVIAPADIDEVDLYFDMLNRSLIVYRDTPDEEGRIRSFVNTHIDNTIRVKTNEDIFFVVESLHGFLEELEEFGGGINGGIQNGQMVGQIIARCRPADDANAAWQEDWINTDSGTVNVILKPVNYSDKEQIYVNEFVESQSDMGAWIRVNDDFSKRIEKEGSDNEFHQDNHVQDGQALKFDYIGDKDLWSPNKALLEAIIEVGSVRPGTVSFTLPRHMVLWELDGEHEPIAHADYAIGTEETFSFDLPTNIVMKRKFFVEAYDKSRAQGTDEIKIEYSPNRAVIGQNRNIPKEKRTPTLHDEALITADFLSAHVDGDRDRKFLNEKIRDKYLLFWTNADREIIGMYDQPCELDSDAHDPNLVDSLDLIIHQKRDREDFAQMLVKTGDLLLNLHTSNRAEMHVLDPNALLAASGGQLSPELNYHLYEWDRPGLDTKDHIEFEKEPGVAGDSLVTFGSEFITAGGEDLYHKRVTPLNVKFDVQKDWWDLDGPNKWNWDKKGFKTKIENVKAERRFVFEARVGAQNNNTALTPTSFIEYRTKTKFELEDFIRVRAPDIADFYDKFAVGGSQEAQEHLKLRRQIIFPAATIEDGRTAKVHDLNGDAPDLEEDRFFNVEDKQFAMCIHGWNNNARDKELFAETFYKRMYWQGYQGRVALFSWPCEVVAERGPTTFEPIDQTFNPSEFHSFRSGMALMNLIAEKTSESKYEERVHVFAHSQGNIAMSEALRIWAYGPEGFPRGAGGIVFENDFLIAARNINRWSDIAKNLRGETDQLLQTYIASNAAISGGAYGSGDQGMNNEIKNLIRMAFEDSNFQRVLTNIGDRFPGLPALYTFAHQAQMRWKDICYASDFYRYFGSGCPRLLSNDNVKSWQPGVSKYVIGNDRWERGVYKGGLHLMAGTEKAVARKINSYYEHDAILELWKFNLYIKSILPMYTCWHWTYPSELHHETGSWLFSVKNKPAWMNDPIKEKKWAAIINALRAIRPITGVEVPAFIQEIASLELNEDIEALSHALFNQSDSATSGDGMALELGNSNSPSVGMVNPGVHMYEILAMSSRSNAIPLGMKAHFNDVPSSEREWIEMNQVDLGSNSNQPGADSNPSHSFFWYHDAYLNRKFYKMYVEEFGVGGIGSTYRDN